MRLFGFEAGGDGVDSGRHASRFSGGAPGVLHGARSYLLQDDDGQTLPTHSVSAGLDYPSVGPEHAWLHALGRAEYRPVTDVEAMDAFACCAAPRGSSRPSSRPTPSPGSWRWGPSSTAGGSTTSR